MRTAVVGDQQMGVNQHNTEDVPNDIVLFGVVDQHITAQLMITLKTADLSGTALALTRTRSIIDHDCVPN